MNIENILRKFEAFDSDERLGEYRNLLSTKNKTRTGKVKQLYDAIDYNKAMATAQIKLSAERR